MLTCIKLLKKKLNRHDSDSYWPTSIKDTINWFPFLTIMEHTANITKTNRGLILSLFKVFAMFEFRLMGDKEHLEVIYIMCFNCKKETGLFLGTSTFEEMITKFVLNAILYHVDMPWIISSNNETKYEIDEDGFQPKMSSSISLSSTQQKRFLLCWNRTNY